MYAHGGACRPDEDRADTGAYCPTRSMVREPYDGIIGDAPIGGAIPLGRVATVRGSLQRHPYTVILEAVMIGKSGAKPEGLSQLNLNAAGIDVGATSHYVAVPADRAEQPVQRVRGLHGGPVPSGGLVGPVRRGHRGHGVHRRVLDTAVRGAGRTELPGDTGGPPAHQERAPAARPTCWTASGCSSCTPTACCRGLSDPTGRSDAYAVTCGSGSCWCSTPPTISSICRRR